MTTTIVNDYFFKPDGDVEEGKAAAAELVEAFKKDFPEVQLSLGSKARRIHSITTTSRFSTMPK